MEDLDAVNTGLRERNCVVAPPKCQVPVGLGAEIMVELCCSCACSSVRLPRNFVYIHKMVSE